MRAFKIPGQTDARPAPGLPSGEKRKLLALGIGAVLVFGAFLYGRMRGSAADDADMVDLPAAPIQQESIFLPEIDGTRIDQLVADGDRLDRVVLETPAVDHVLGGARRLTPRHFEELEAVELDRAGIERLVAQPSARRGAAFFARGVVDSLRTRQRGSDLEYIGRLRLDDESTCYFLVLDAPENGGYVRVDGLFLKVYSDEDDLVPGDWIDGPMLVGPRAVRSYRALGEVTELRAEDFADVEDAAFFDRNGELLPDAERRVLLESPFDAQWRLMAYARDLPADAVDWDAAPELDPDVLREFMLRPDDWRLRPVRIPISRVQDGRVLAVGENPARIDSITQGWMGNHGWQNVVKFLSPRPDPTIRLRDYAFGKGFFFHNFAYPSAASGMRIAPVVVLSELTRFEDRSDPLWKELGFAFGAFTVLSIVAFFLLVLRDRRRSAALQEELVRRRRSRRSRSTPAGQPSA